MWMPNMIIFCYEECKNFGERIGHYYSKETNCLVNVGVLSILCEFIKAHIVLLKHLLRREIHSYSTLSFIARLPLKSGGHNKLMTTVKCTVLEH